jgi:hypothetical protein
MTASSAITTHEYRPSRPDDENEDDEEYISDADEEQLAILEPVQGLFSTDIFPNVLDMFRSYQAKFDLVAFLRIHRIDSQYDYIRLINYIRREVTIVVFLSLI